MGQFRNDVTHDFPLAAEELLDLLHDVRRLMDASSHFRSIEQDAQGTWHVEEWLTLAHCCVRFLVDLEQRDNGARIVCRAPMWVTVDTTWTVDALPPAPDGSPRCRGREDSTVTCPLVVRPFVKAQFKRTHSELPARIVRYLADERRQKEDDEKPASPTAAPA